MRLKNEYEARKAAQKSRQEQTASEHERAAHEAELAKERFWKHPDKIVRYTGWLSWYTFALFVATLFLFFTAVITACILHRTDESIRLQTRSNLVFNKVVFPRDSDRFALQDGSRYRNFLTVWTNAGNTPTERTIIRVGCSNIPWSFVDNTERRNNWTSRVWAIGPKNDVSLTSCPLTDISIEEYIRGPSVLFIFGEATYFDATSTERREADFCVRIVDFRKVEGGIDGNALPCEQPRPKQ